MTRLNADKVMKRLLAEADEGMKKPTVQKMAAPNGKTREVGKPKDPSSKKTTIKQVEVPTSHRNPGAKGKSSGKNSGIPTAPYAGKVADGVKVPSFKMSRPETSPPTPKVERLKPNQTTNLRKVEKKIKNTEGGSTKGSVYIPQAEMAGNYTRKMSHGTAAFGKNGNGTPTVKPDAPKNLNGTTSPARKAASMKTPKDGKTVDQVKHKGSFSKDPSDAPAKPKWSTEKNGHNVVESVQIVLNGRPKATFGVANKAVINRMVENYRAHGYDVTVRKGPDAAWKSDREFLQTVFESMDATYNNAPSFARSLRKKAMNRFFQLMQGDFNRMYESRQDFTNTLLAAFDRIMEKADLNYRRSLIVVEGLARVEVGGNVMDLEMITQARDENMALRQFRDEIVENYGFDAKITHIFVDGEKKSLRSIKEWAPSR